MRHRGSVVAEGLRIALARRWPAVLTAVIIATMVGTVVSAIGAAGARRQSLLDALDRSDLAVVEVRYSPGTSVGDREAGLESYDVEAIRSLDAVTEAVAFSSVESGWSPALGERAGTMAVVGAVGGLPSADRAASGRAPREGEGMLVGPVTAESPLGSVPGTIETRSRGRIPVVAAGTLPDFVNFPGEMVVVNESPDREVSSIFLRAVNGELAVAVADRVPQLVALTALDGLEVEVSSELIRVRAEVASRLDRDRLVVSVAAIAAAALVVGVISITTVHNDRRAIARRRAMGASRETVVLLVLVEVVAVSLFGGLAGIVAIALARTDVLRELGGVYVLATIALAVAVSALASMPAAAVAASGDPARRLRVP